MIHIPRWKVIAIVLSCLLGFAYVAPNFLSEPTRVWMQANLPGVFPMHAINLGLDLQGGSHLMLKVDSDAVLSDHAENLTQSLRPELRKAKIGYTRIAAIPGGVRIALRTPSDAEAVRKIIRDIEGDDVEVLAGADGLVEARLTEAAIRKMRDQTIGQSIEIVRRRVDETGTREPIIQRQGDDRIVLQLPGVDDPQHMKNLIGTTAKLGFHLLAESGAAGATKTLPLADPDRPSTKLAIERKPIITGDMLDSATFCQGQGGEPAVCFRFNGIGTRRFCDVTRENVGKPFAIVLDEKILSAPNIREPICGGSGQISGSFTVKEANDLSLLLRAGALPAPLSIVEERTVGPSLGSDSVASGKIAGLAAIGIVVAFMFLTYGPVFGSFASAALLINIVFIFAMMSALGATLTLPGIAGIILTIGMAVDANVLIFERMREEVRSGRSLVAAIDSGYTRAVATVVDSNVTTLIAAGILFMLGSGPVKGFAVSLTIGILTSVYSAVALTRLMVLTWLRMRKPKTLPI
jgi:preprotein translocase subunit SecD